MMCPLLAIASTIDKTGNSSCECQRKSCVWFMEDTTKFPFSCAVTVIASSLNRILTAIKEKT